MVRRGCHNWTNKDDEYLLKNYGGITAQKIGDAIGVSKNAVIGRYNKLKKGSPVIYKPKKVKPKVKLSNKVSIRAMVEDEKVIEVSFNGKKSLLNLGAGECRYTTDGKEYCAGQIAKHSYCQEHVDLCYQKSAPRTKETKYPIKRKVVLY